MANKRKMQIFYSKYSIKLQQLLSKIICFSIYYFIIYNTGCSSSLGRKVLPNKEIFFGGGVGVSKPRFFGGSSSITWDFFFSEKTYFPSCVLNIFLVTFSYKYHATKTLIHEEKGKEEINIYMYVYILYRYTLYNIDGM